MFHNAPMVRYHAPRPKVREETLGRRRAASQKKTNHILHVHISQLVASGNLAKVLRACIFWRVYGSSLNIDSGGSYFDQVSYLIAGSYSATQLNYLL